MRIKLSILVCLLLVFVPAHAQDDTLLSQVLIAYQNTATATSYQVEIEDTVEQSTSFTRFLSNVYLMNVAIDDIFILTQTTETTTSARINGDNIEDVSIQTAVTQVQQVGLQYRLDDEVIGLPEEIEDEVELNIQMRLIDGELSINLDDTDEIYRVGVPEGWFTVTDEAQVLTDTTVTLDDLITILNNARLNTESILSLLNSENVISTEALEDDELEGQPMKRYLITINGTGALGELGLDKVELPEEAINSLLENAAYSIEVWVGANNQLIFQQQVLFSMSGDFPTGTLSGDFADTGVSFSYNREYTATYSGFDVEFPIETNLFGG